VKTAHFVPTQEPLRHEEKEDVSTTEFNVCGVWFGPSPPAYLNERLREWSTTRGVKFTLFVGPDFPRNSWDSLFHNIKVVEIFKHLSERASGHQDYINNVKWLVEKQLYHAASDAIRLLLVNQGWVYCDCDIIANAITLPEPGRMVDPKLLYSKDPLALSPQVMASPPDDPSILKLLQLQGEQLKEGKQILERYFGTELSACELGDAAMTDVITTTLTGYGIYYWAYMLIHPEVTSDDIPQLDTRLRAEIKAMLPDNFHLYLSSTYYSDFRSQRAIGPFEEIHYNFNTRFRKKLNDQLKALRERAMRAPEVFPSAAEQPAKQLPSASPPRIGGAESAPRTSNACP
jgi:hypothetical protein